MKLRIGTSGFSYEDWKDAFYPATINKNEMLSFYAKKFNTVEINVTYYTIPGQSSFEKMASKTSPDFNFIVKVNQETTHRRDENKKSIEQLLQATQPLRETKQFAGLLAQFPYSFKNNENNRRYLLKTREFTKDYPLFVEFRNDSWQKDAIRDFLSVNDIGYVNVDEPALKGLISPQNWLTSKNGYIRFHGRNLLKWWDGKGSERYEYEYSNDELQSWLIRISDILKKSYKSYIFFNNHPKANAPKNAAALAAMITRYIKD